MEYVGYMGQEACKMEVKEPQCPPFLVVRIVTASPVFFILSLSVRSAAGVVRDTQRGTRQTEVTALRRPLSNRRGEILKNNKSKIY